MSPSTRANNLLELPKETPHICVAVIGAPSFDFTDANAGRLTEGIGKSCLCSRFVLPSHDDYLATGEDHQSTVPQSSFDDPEWAGLHYLYFGSVVKRPCPSRQLVVFHVVEQTIFVDERMTPHPGHERYATRATAAALTSPPKVSYLGKRFTGRDLDKREHFPVMFDGQRHCVGGYLLVMDPTRSEKEIDQQIDVLRSCVQHIDQQRNPFRLALAITKCDAVCADQLHIVREKVSERFRNISCFEVSARHGVAVEAPFYFIYNAVEATTTDRKTPIVHLPFLKSSVIRQKAESRAVERLQRTLRKNVTRFDVTFREMTLRLVAKGQGEALAAVLSLKGRAVCKSIFKDRLVEIKAAELQDAFNRVLSAALLAHPDVGSGDALNDVEYTRQCFPHLDLRTALSCTGHHLAPPNHRSSRKTPEQDRINNCLLSVSPSSSSSTEELSQMDNATHHRASSQIIESNVCYSDAVIDILGPLGFNPSSGASQSLVAPHYAGGVQSGKALIRKIAGDGLWSLEPTPPTNSFAFDDHNEENEASGGLPVDPCYAAVSLSDVGRRRKLSVSLPRGVPGLAPSPTPSSRRRLKSTGSDVVRQQVIKDHRARSFCIGQSIGANKALSPPVMFTPESSNSVSPDSELSFLRPLNFVSPAGPPSGAVLSLPVVQNGLKPVHAHSRSSPVTVTRTAIEVWEHGHQSYPVEDANGYLTPAELFGHRYRTSSPETDRLSAGSLTQLDCLDEERPARLNSPPQAGPNVEQVHTPVTEANNTLPLMKRSSAPVVLTRIATAVHARPQVQVKSGKLHLSKKDVVYEEVGPPSRLPSVDQTLNRPFSALNGVRLKPEFTSSPNLRVTTQTAALPSGKPWKFPISLHRSRRKSPSLDHSPLNSPADEVFVSEGLKNMSLPSMPDLLIPATPVQHSRQSAFRPVNPQAKMAGASPVINIGKVPAPEVPQEDLLISSSNSSADEGSGHDQPLETGYTQSAKGRTTAVEDSQLRKFETSTPAPSRETVV